LFFFQGLKLVFGSHVGRGLRLVQVVIQVDIVAILEQDFHPRMLCVIFLPRHGDARESLLHSLETIANGSGAGNLLELSLKRAAHSAHWPACEAGETTTVQFLARKVPGFVSRTTRSSLSLLRKEPETALIDHVVLGLVRCQGKHIRPVAIAKAVARSLLVPRPSSRRWGTRRRCWSCSTDWSPQGSSRQSQGRLHTWPRVQRLCRGVQIRRHGSRWIVKRHAPRLRVVLLSGMCSWVGLTCGQSPLQDR
jgi:hypothetical protein